LTVEENLNQIIYLLLRPQDNQNKMGRPNAQLGGRLAGRLGVRPGTGAVERVTTKRLSEGDARKKIERYKLAITTESKSGSPVKIDARQKLENMRNQKMGKLEEKKIGKSGIVLTTKLNGRLELTTKKKGLVTKGVERSEPAKEVKKIGRLTLMKNASGKVSLSSKSAQASKSEGVMRSEAFKDKKKPEKENLTRTIKGSPRAMSEADRLDDMLMNEVVDPALMRRTIEQSAQAREREMRTKPLRTRERSPLRTRERSPPLRMRMSEGDVRMRMNEGDARMRMTEGDVRMRMSAPVSSRERSPLRSRARSPVGRFARDSPPRDRFQNRFLARSVSPEPREREQDLRRRPVEGSLYDDESRLALENENEMLKRRLKDQLEKHNLQARLDTLTSNKPAVARLDSYKASRPAVSRLDSFTGNKQAVARLESFTGSKKVGSAVAKVDTSVGNSPLQGFKVIITNLQTSVTQEDVLELFGDIGALRRAKLIAPGHAEVTFVNRKDALKAVEIYHNRQLDGKPMKCILTSQTGGNVGERAGFKLPASLAQAKKRDDGAPPPDIESIHRALFNKKNVGKKPLFTITMPKKTKEEQIQW